MSAASETLDSLMRANLNEGAFAVAGDGGDLFMEVMDTTTGLVWMTAAPVQTTDFDKLVLDETLVKVGCASASMDRAGFQYSPGAPGQPVLERVIDGRLYINVAAPLEQTPPSQPGGPMEISVDKAHVIGFEVGRAIAILSLPEGDFVEVVGDASNDQALVLSEGASLKQVLLQQPWLVTLPTPTRTLFWFGQSMRSFQGPVTLPQG
jgi:hypothetical protein